ncbi:SDR family NAD(P)-dependent oxidoreductase [Mycetocola manganoxydans]|uniref:3beta-hydroxysteroid 3-dehydrogenase n=1 Tax=Mycetocola manganoxydans TaxID=699879 RepID=A0A3L6ZZT6_9MICO|nr:SDR family NAD(P)-dependent oxidoreductase [Mycetocola manganoxydans]RLP72901.1 SDR family NAD(P)-dependent oxidoreductase [Mycetocola manganoxydans]GHD45067.1 oxidoreductase [Mycetocola manganoxydans]
MSWDPARLPSQSGRTVAVTGANAGLGFWTSYALAGAGASVVLACRDEGRADAAVRAIRAHVPDADLSVLKLDTADLSSVRAAGEHLGGLARLDALVLNAGIVHPPKHRAETADGLELIAATNFFGHFALAAAALPALDRTPDSRVVSLGSIASMLVSLRTDDLQLTRRYSSWQAYAQSKIMLSSFGFELDRRLRAQGSGIRSLVTHPGYSISGRTPRVPGVNEPSRLKRFVDALQGPFTQGKNQGAEPVLRAITDPDAAGGSSLGPRFLLKGEARFVKPAPITTDERTARAIWAEAEVATGTTLL